MKEISKRKCIAFDMDVNALKELYKDGDWHNAYNDIGRFLNKNGFERMQGSVYDSKKAMKHVKLNDIIDNLANSFEWFAPCVKSIRGYDRPKIVDYTSQIKETIEKSLFQESELSSKEAKIKAMKEKARQIAKNSHSEPSKDKGLER